jgi:hypothetical protein
MADERYMLYSKGGLPNRPSSSGQLVSKVKLVGASMANFSLNKIRVLNDGYEGYLRRKR